MRKSSTMFLQSVIVLIGIVALGIMIRFPLTEGRAVNLSLVRIYADPFIIYVYLASIVFFVALYQAFKVLGYIGKNKIFSLDSVKALRNIRYCAIVLSILIVLAGAYIRIFHAQDDDPAGFLALCIMTTFASLVVAIVAAVFERKVQSAIHIQSGNNVTA
jgi:hypothetical protein